MGLIPALDIIITKAIRKTAVGMFTNPTKKPITAVTIPGVKHIACDTIRSVKVRVRALLTFRFLALISP
jgi:hypothetical protein